MLSSMQDIFAAHMPAYAQLRPLHPREQRAAWCISRCYTAAMGSSVWRCPAGHFERVQFHACRHRSCPRCAEAPRQRWIAQELQRLLPCPHFHVVFTLPHSLLPLWEFNRAALAQLLFDCARQSLLQLLADPRHLGAVPGILMALHTWGRTLSHHPHVHCLVSAGGLSPEQAWRPCRAGFLLPLKPLQALFRGKLLARLWKLASSGRLALPPRQALAHWRAVVCGLYRRHWNIQINPPYAHGRGVALYLARYAKGGPCPKSRPLYDNDGRITMPYTDHRDGQRKRLQLSTDEFISRVLWHAAPRGQHTTRHAGLYASAQRVQHTCARIALGESATLTWRPTPNSTLNQPPTPEPTCPHCSAPLLRFTYPARPHRYSEFSVAPGRGAPTAAHLGPTGRSNGHSKAGVCRAPPPEAIIGSARQTPAFECRSTQR